MSEHLKDEINLLLDGTHIIDREGMEQLGGMIVFLDQENNLLDGIGKQIVDLEHESYFHKMDWDNLEQGKLYILDKVNYHLYHQKNSIGINIIYLRQKDLLKKPF